MAKSVAEWVKSDVAALQNENIRDISERFFFRDPIRSQVISPSFFFSPADGVIIYQTVVEAQDGIVNVKGRDYSLRDALRIPDLNGKYLVIGIFMTAYDVHINRVPLAGYLRYRPLPALNTNNLPMLDIEENLVYRLSADISNSAHYLFTNQRMVNSVYSPHIGTSYYILQVADFDVAMITPFRTEQSARYSQNERFSQIRFGSQVDLIIPCNDRYSLDTLVPTGYHVEGGVDALVKINSNHVNVRG